MPFAGKAKRETVRVLTYEELASDVCRLANALRALGMKKGDVAALFMPMTPETVVALFAVVKTRRHHSAAFFRLRRRRRRRTLARQRHETSVHR